MFNSVLINGLNGTDLDIFLQEVDLYYRSILFKYFPELIQEKDDLFQELFLLLQSKKKYIIAADNVKKYVCSIIFNYLKRRRQDLTRYYRRFQPSAEMHISGCENVSNIEDIEFVNLVKANCSATQLKIYKLRFEQNLSLKKIARRERVPVGTVKSRINSLVTKARSVYESQCSPRRCLESVDCKSLG